MRLKIALRNLVISQIIIIIFLIFAYLVWFPYSFSDLGGFTETALMLIFVDLVLGPLLVFIVFKEGKKYLKFDINVLLAIQVAAFLFGAHALFLKHPAYIVFTGDRFTLTNVSHLYPQQTWHTQFKKSFFSSPKFVVAKLPSDALKQSNLILDIVFNQTPDLDRRPEYYHSFEKHTETTLAKSIPINKLLSNTKTKQKLAEFLEQHGGKPEAYAYFPLSGNNKKEFIWVFDRVSAKPIGLIDSDPWIKDIVDENKPKTQKRMI